MHAPLEDGDAPRRSREPISTLRIGWAHHLEVPTLVELLVLRRRQELLEEHVSAELSIGPLSLSSPFCLNPSYDGLRQEQRRVDQSDDEDDCQVDREARHFSGVRDSRDNDNGIG